METITLNGELTEMKTETHSPWLSADVCETIEKGAGLRKIAIRSGALSNMVKFLSMLADKKEPMRISSTDAKDKYKISFNYYGLLFAMGICRRLDGGLIQYALSFKPSLTLAEAVFNYALATIQDDIATVALTTELGGTPVPKRKYKRRKKGLWSRIVKAWQELTK